MKRRLLSNFWLKTIAVVIAAAIWLAVSADRREATIERTFGVPLALVGIPNNLIVTTAVRDTIDVRMRGGMSALRALSSQNLEATVDLSDVKAGSVEVRIRRAALNVPNNVEVVSIEPEKLRFRIEPVRNKSVPIRAYLVGEPAPGFEVGEPVVFPPITLVAGPASMLQQIDEIATERIILSGRRGSFRTRVALVSDSSLVRVVDATGAQVEVPIFSRADAAGADADADATTTSTEGTPP